MACKKRIKKYNLGGGTMDDYNPGMDILGNTLSGAATGSAFGPIGAAVGAGVGLTTGAITSIQNSNKIAQINQEKERNKLYSQSVNNNKDSARFVPAFEYGGGLINSDEMITTPNGEEPMAETGVKKINSDTYKVEGNQEQGDNINFTAPEGSFVTPNKKALEKLSNDNEYKLLVEKKERLNRSKGRLEKRIEKEPNDVYLNNSIELINQNISNLEQKEMGIRKRLGLDGGNEEQAMTMGGTMKKKYYTGGGVDGDILDEAYNNLNSFEAMNAYEMNKNKSSYSMPVYEDLIKTNDNTERTTRTISGEQPTVDINTSEMKSNINSFNQTTGDSFAITPITSMPTASINNDFINNRDDIAYRNIIGQGTVGDQNDTELFQVEADNVTNPNSLTPRRTTSNIDWNNNEPYMYSPTKAKGVMDTSGVAEKAARNNTITPNASIPTSSKIGMGIQLASSVGNLAMLAREKNQPEQYKAEEIPLLKAEQIDASEQLRQNERMAANARGNIRNINTGQGSYLANTAAVNLGAGQQAASIQERVDNINAQNRQQTEQANRNIIGQNIASRLNVQNLNVAERDAYLQNIMSSIGNIGDVSAGIAKDTAAYKSQQDALKYYGRQDATPVQIGSTTVMAFRNANGELGYIDNGKWIKLN